MTRHCSAAITKVSHQDAAVAVVVAVGESAEDFAIGTPVFGVCEPSQDGAYAEKIAINADKVVARPDWLTHTQAAAIGNYTAAPVCEALF